MNRTQSLQANHHPFPQQNPKLPQSLLPLKFKAMILKSIYDKHRNKQLFCKRNAFFTWYVQKNGNQLIKDYIDRVLIAQNEAKFTTSRFFYRMKYFIRKELMSINEKVQEQPQTPVEQDKQKQKSSYSQIRQSQNCLKKNFADYFQSLKNIFSMKLIQCQNSILSDSLSSDQKSRHQRFKTEGCELGKPVDQSFQAICRLSIYRKEKIMELQKKQIEINKKFSEIELKQNEIERKLGDRVKSVKELGKKVAFILIKSFIANKQKKMLHYSFTLLSTHSQQSKLLQQSQITKLHHLQLLTKQSSQFQIQTEPTTTLSTTSQSFLQTPRSSQSSLPPISHITNQISHVEYSISILSQTLKKDSDLKELYKQFQQQFGEFQAIEKDFQLLRVETRNSLFDRLINIKKKLKSYLIKQAFHLIKQSTQNKTTKKTITQKNISRSRVNLQTLHNIFSRPLIPLTSQPNNKNDKQDQQLQVQRSMTSIKYICESNSNNDSKFYKPSQSRGLIKKQTFKFNSNKNNDDCGSVHNEVSCSEMPSTLGQNFFKQKPTVITFKPSTTSPAKSHVNFVLPQRQQQQQQPISSSKWPTKPKKSQLSLQQMKDGFRKKPEHKMNSMGFYDLSMKSFDSDASSSTSKNYHAQLKSQYWWNDIEEKENFVLRDGSKERSRGGSRESIGNGNDEGV